MTDLELISYFEKIARQLKSIGHTADKKQFTRFDIEEVFSGLRNKINLNNWTLCLESHEGKLLGRGDEAVTDQATFAFMVIRKSSGNFDQEAQTISEALVICKKIIALLLRDKRLAILGEKPSFLKGLDTSVFEYQKVGPVFDSAYGRRVELRIQQNEALLVDPADWDEAL